MYKLIENFINTLLYSWGSEAPAEAIWAANDYLKTLEFQYGYTFENNFTESYGEVLNNNYEEVMKEIENLLDSN